MEKTKVTKKGQVTIPQELREKLGIKEGTKVRMDFKEGEIVISIDNKAPFEKMKELRNKINFSDKEIRSMIKESKKRWSKFK